MNLRGLCSPRYAAILCVLGTLAATPVPAAGQNHPKRVLLLFDEDTTLPGLSILDQTIRSTLSAGLGEEVEFFTESLRAAQFPEAQHQLALRDYYVKAHASRKLDLIIGVMGPAMKFLLQHGDPFAPGVPIVFCLTSMPMRVQTARQMPAAAAFTYQFRALRGRQAGRDYYAMVPLGLVPEAVPLRRRRTEAELRRTNSTTASYQSRCRSSVRTGASSLPPTASMSRTGSIRTS